MDLQEMVKESLGLTAPPKRERYFAIVIEGDESLGGLLRASTKLGDLLRDQQETILPPGFKITRSIEITKQRAQETW